MAGAALLLVGCATATTARENSEKSVTYPQLHRQMVRLAEESAKSGGDRPSAALSPSSSDLGGNPALAANP